ncbi:hypothetical protein RB195_020680 [Necator americanus]|uniref:Uncharacterized protein n=1 Tax=Necator americanus TaxID=51031 RepID=A0ABR1CJZ7_NECAM
MACFLSLAIALITKGGIFFELDIFPEEDESCRVRYCTRVLRRYDRGEFESDLRDRVSVLGPEYRDRICPVLPVDVDQLQNARRIEGTTQRSENSRGTEIFGSR